MGQAQRKDPVSEFEHHHGRINDLVFRLQVMLHPKPGKRIPPALAKLLGELREELIFHFVREEEGLFPFIRTHLPDQRDAVDRLEAAHDGICGAIVRLSHLAEHEADRAALLAMFERFERPYAEHGKEEGRLFQELGKRLKPTQRQELAELVRGL